jgi:hypothetical protein
MAKLTKKHLSEQIIKYSGNLTAVAKAFGKSRTTIYTYVEKHELQPVLDEARDTMLDNVESTLYKQALEGNTTAMIFYLKTQGKSRGYVESNHVDLTSGGQKIKGYIGFDPEEWDADSDAE